MSKPITLGIQSPEGQKRIQIKLTARLEELYKEVQKAFGLGSTNFLLSQDQKKEVKIDNNKIKTVAQVTALFCSKKNNSKKTFIIWGTYQHC